MCQPAAGGDLLQLASGEEADLMSVWRPKWITGIVGARHRLGLKRVERAEPKLTFSVHRDRDRDLVSVGRDGESAQAPRVVRRGDSVAQRGCFPCRFPEMDE